MAFFWSGFRGVDVFLIAENQEKIPLPVTNEHSLTHVTKIGAPP